jgi:hypothetical protein
LGIGVGIFYQKGAVPKAQPVATPKLQGGAYDGIPAPEITNSDVLWPQPPDQSVDRDEPESGWVYQVFTPPKIYWETGIGWEAQGPKPVLPAPQFGLKYLSTGQDLYRVQVQGVSGTGDKDDVINFSDEETHNNFHLKVGETNDVSKREEIQVLDMTFNKKEDHGVITNVATVTILDQRTNEQVKLTEGELFSPTGTRYVILQFSDPFPEKEWHVTQEGDEMEFPGNTPGFDSPDPIVFKVVALDFDAPSVTVEREVKNKRHVIITPVLSKTFPEAEAAAAPAADASTAKSTTSTSTPASRPPARQITHAAASSASATVPKRDTTANAGSIGQKVATPTPKPAATTGTTGTYNK